MKRKKNNNSNNKGSNKKRFELEEGETIDQCLERIHKEGYTPTRRTEQPVFQEVEQDGEMTYQPIGRKIVFDATLPKGER